jgi:hypothetical protein
MKLLWLALAAIVLLAVPVTVRGQAGGDVSAAGLAVSPAILEVAGKPGETVERKFNIQNISGQPMPVSATLDRLRPTEAEIDLSKSESFNASQWIAISEPYHILDDKERRELTAVVSVPEDAEPGGHYATIIMQPMAPETSLNGSGARIAPKVGILVFITVPGDAVRELSVNTSASRLHLSKQVPFTAEFRNTGTIHALPTGKITIRNLFGSTKAELPLQPRIVLPNTVKEFAAEWDGPFLFGIYSAETEATYGPGQTQLTSGKRYFVVFRWLPLILAALPLVLIGWFVRRTYGRWGDALRAFRSAETVAAKDTEQMAARSLHQATKKSPKLKPLKPKLLQTWKVFRGKIHKK